ncbi:DUF262 domain-containing protein [Streptomyces sp. SID8014]|uniref:GmrSD restriction endonuclease domain-containing protein n=1 Tax=Streptomyces sp. SID8014 TaxID=2706097 RepID=UPI0013B7C08F|nr:DUF262 domain-containing protein [Streptomyces sp. SID8014]NEC14901.1 DUF262 domain-containing protein [Streptomyces sp. SID8014]
MQSNLIQSKVMTVEEVFTGRQYRLDTYQREFTWGRSDVRRLIDDLRKKFSANWRLEHDRTRVARYQPYFLGPYVYHEEDRTTYLVDGQQRITTLHLMLIYLRELLRAQDLEDEAGRLTSLIKSRKYGRSVHTLDIPDRSVFLEEVFTEKGFSLPDDAPGALRKLWEASCVFQEEFPEELRGDALPYFVDWLLEGVCLVGIQAGTSEQGWEIYESMNDRGVRLGPIDLLKSFLLSKIDKAPDGADKVWRRTVSELAAVDVNAPSDFLKTFLIARFARIPTSDDSSSTDVEKISGPFHTWVKENASALGLIRSSDHRALIDELEIYANHYRTLAAAARAYVPDLASVFFNAYNGMSIQTAPVLAAVHPRDSLATCKAKAKLVADYLDLVLVRRLVNDLPCSPADLDQEAVRLVGLLRGGLDVSRLREVLAEEIARLPYDFDAMKTYGLRSNNSRQVRYLLARLTGFVESSCSRSDEMGAYLDGRRPFEIEHIWANRFERYQPETKKRPVFDSYRNRLGALLLLKKSDNASYQDLPYEEKVDYYQRQNHLAGSLHVKHRERNPDFNKFVRTRKLDGLLRPFPKFTMSAIEERQKLYQKLCEIVWDPAAAFGTPAVPTQRVDRSRTRTRARYDVAITDLVAKGMLPQGVQLVGSRRGVRFGAEVLDDGRIRVDSGETFGSLSAAGEFVLQSQSCAGWNFWRARLGEHEVKLVDVRREALEQGLV